MKTRRSKTRGGIRVGRLALYSGIVAAANANDSASLESMKRIFSPETTLSAVKSTGSLLSTAWQWLNQPHTPEEINRVAESVAKYIPTTPTTFSSSLYGLTNDPIVGTPEKSKSYRIAQSEFESLPHPVQDAIQKYGITYESTNDLGEHRVKINTEDDVEGYGNILYVTSLVEQKGGKRRRTKRKTLRRKRQWTRARVSYGQ